MAKREKQTLGHRIREVRKDRGISQTDLAEMVGVRQGTISRIESGTISQPRFSDIARIADALGCRMEYLVRDKEQRKEVV